MATATNSRIFGVSHSGAINTIPGFTNSGRLHAADTQSTPQNNSYANVFWCNGVDESRFTWSIAYIIRDSEGNATVSTTVGVDPEGDYVGEAGTADAYIRFKGGSGNAAFIAACQHIVSLNEAAGYAYGNPAPVNGTAAEWKTWMDANADYWTNFVSVATTTTTEGPSETYNYFYGTICTTSTTVQIRSTRPALEWTAPATYNLAGGLMSQEVANLFPEGLHAIVNLTGESNVDNYNAEGANQITFNTAPPTATCSETP